MQRNGFASTRATGPPRASGVALAALVGLLCAAIACGPRRQPPDVPVSPTTGAIMGQEDQDRLAALAKERATPTPGDGYHIGPDDLLDVRIPDLLEPVAYGRPDARDPGEPVAGAPSFQQGARVSGSGDITLPLLGQVPAKGRTASQLEREIAARLVSGGILRAPQVSVTVAEHRSGVVAVVGAVEKPGLYPLTRPGATLSDLVWAAGGPAKESGRLVEFVPLGAEPGAAGGNGHRRPIRVDLGALMHQRAGTTLVPDPQVRPGDVIRVGPAGNVLVQGWVEKPGAYAVTPGLSVTGAVAAAGGPLFAADRNRVQVSRRLDSGEQQSFTVDLEAVSSGQAGDVPITDGDVVRIGSSTTRVVPWAVWTTVKEVVRVGGNVLLF